MVTRGVLPVHTKSVTTAAKDVRAIVASDEGVIARKHSLAVSAGEISLIDGPYVEKPLITTGAGDHFNSGFCLGKLLGFENAASVLMGVTASGYYVRSAQSPTIGGLVETLRNWPTRA